MIRESRICDIPQHKGKYYVSCTHIQRVHTLNPENVKPTSSYFHNISPSMQHFVKLHTHEVTSLSIFHTNTIQCDWPLCTRITPSIAPLSINGAWRIYSTTWAISCWMFPVHHSTALPPNYLISIFHLNPLSSTSPSRNYPFDHPAITTPTLHQSYSIQITSTYPPHIPNPCIPQSISPLIPRTSDRMRVFLSDKLTPNSSSKLRRSILSVQE